jgi:hypothetical protein
MSRLRTQLEQLESSLAELAENGGAAPGQTPASRTGVAGAEAEARTKASKGGRR